MATDVPGRACPQCQHPLDQEATACPNCGQVLSEASGPAPAVTTPLAASDAEETLPSAARPGEANSATLAAESPANEPPADASATLPADLGSPPATGDASPPPEPKAATMPTRVSRRLKIALISAAVLLILVATGGGTLYALTRPQPLIAVTSDYQVGGAPAGSATTPLHVAGKQFSANSAITFLLDGHPAPGSQIVPSDENGVFEADVTVTARWTIGTHQLTARDANGNTTKSSVKLVVVHQGEAGTPGPYGSPANDTAHFTLYITILLQLVVNPTAIPLNLGSDILTLTVQGQPDPAGGAVCNLPKDDGQSHTTGISLAPGGTFTIIPIGSNGAFIFPTKETTAYTCSGAYQGGKISYTETNTVDKEVFSNGVTCSLPSPRVTAQLQGAFNSATTATGTYNVPASALKCSDGSTQKTLAETGTWFALLFS
ncbi:MAG TPA: hypothetical protein VFU69_07460 [Ktedonobacterales bacterium]|nr:hypothetical protein [Ktedonobacterales bacterium]